MIKREYEFSALYRGNHWVRAISIIVLIITGFYIADPFLAPFVSNEPVLFMNAWWRFWHLVFGFALIATTMIKMYLFFFDKNSRIERASFWDFINPKVWFQQLKFYLLVGSHPHGKGVYNPLQFAAYLMLFVVIFLIILTGLILYMHVYHNGMAGAMYGILQPFEVMMGGLANVRTIHHIATWVFIIFIPIHIYMAVFNSIHLRKGSMDAIISGYVWPEHKKDDEHKEVKK